MADSPSKIVPRQPADDAALAEADAEFLDAMHDLAVDSGAWSGSEGGVPDPSRRTAGRRCRAGESRRPRRDERTGAFDTVRPGHALPEDPPPRRRGRRRKGRKVPLTVEARLDLHGSGVDEALDRLDLFLVRASASGHGRVLVITGRGRRSVGGEPVLRKVVLDWLRRAGRSHVREILTAPPELGGSGALVLMLRRGAHR